MNYIKEINGFERWVETHYLSANAQLLWYKLMSLFNKSGWREWVSADNLRLMAAIGVSREETLIQARKQLIDAGLIVFHRGRKGSPSRYRMVCFFPQEEVQSEAETEAKNAVYCVGQSGDIIKQNKIKTKNKNRERGEASRPQKGYGDYANVFLTDEELAALKEEFPDWEARIKRLSGYMASSGKRYQSHFATIKNWAEEDFLRRKEKESLSQEKQQSYDLQALDRYWDNIPQLD